MHKLPSEAGEYLFASKTGKLGHLIVTGSAPYLHIDRCYLLATVDDEAEVTYTSLIENILYKITGTQIAPVQ